MSASRLGEAVFLAAFVLAGSTPTPALEVGALEVGTVVPDWNATTVDGHAVSLSKATQTHKAVVVVFLSTVCPYSNYFSDHLRVLDAEYGRKGVLLVGVNSNRTETVQEAIDHARQYRLSFPLVKDAGNKIADLLGAQVTPEAFLVDSEGRLRYRGRVRSKIGSTELKDAIEAVLAGRPVKTPVAKAFGCAITRESPVPRR
jgi:peroxiredoxin